VNLDGEAVGISAAVSSEAEGIGFAVPVNVARAVLAQLRDQGRVRRGYLGIQLHELDPDLARMIGLGEPRGALVVDVVEGEPAAMAGLRRWDVITAVSGESIEDATPSSGISSCGAPSEAGVRPRRPPVTVAARLGERGSTTRRPSPAAGSVARGRATPWASPWPRCPRRRGQSSACRASDSGS
jgi:S1-C subfamily serine protease